MELTEPIESLNSQLEREFGIDSDTGRVMYRIVFAEDQIEKRLTEYDDKGNQLLHAEVRELPKYRQWIQGKYILEMLMYIDNPETVKELAGQRLSYECIFVFENRHEQAIPPTYEVCQIVITAMKAAMNPRGGYVKYKDDTTPEKRKQDIDKIYAELYGNETQVGDALAKKSGIGYGEN